MEGGGPVEGGPVEAVTTVSSIVSFMDESFCVSSSTVAVVGTRPS